MAAQVGVASVVAEVAVAVAGEGVVAVDLVAAEAAEGAAPAVRTVAVGFSARP